MRTGKTPLLATFGILLLPFLFSSSLESQINKSVVLTPLVYAGHLIGANNIPCECGGPIENCICEEGATPSSVPGEPEDKTDDPSTSPTQGDPNLGPLTLLVVLAFLVWRFGR